MQPTGSDEDFLSSWILNAADAEQVPSDQSIMGANLYSNEGREMTAQFGYASDNPHRDAFLAFCLLQNDAAPLYCLLELNKYRQITNVEENETLSRAEAV